MKTGSTTLGLGMLHRLLLVPLALGYVATAHAVLGGSAGSVEVDRLHMNAKYAARTNAPAVGNYTIQEMTLPSGTSVRQFVSSTSGVVFAVTWSGPFVPDLRQLMGSHFDKMVARQTGTSQAGHRFVRQQYSDLVVESGGHPRSFTGRAFLPAALPAGVALQDIH
jgi:hypothetical protein